MSKQNSKMFRVATVAVGALALFVTGCREKPDPVRGHWVEKANSTPVEFMPDGTGILYYQTGNGNERARFHWKELRPGLLQADFDVGDSFHTGGFEFIIGGDSASMTMNGGVVWNLERKNDKVKFVASHVTDPGYRLKKDAKSRR